MECEVFMNTKLISIAPQQFVKRFLHCSVDNKILAQNVKKTLKEGNNTIIAIWFALIFDGNRWLIKHPDFLIEFYNHFRLEHT